MPISREGKDKTMLHKLTLSMVNLYFRKFDFQRQGWTILDLTYDFINSTPARYGLYNNTMLRSISTPLTVNSANIPVRKDEQYANSLKIQHFGTFSTHPDPGFLITCPDFLSTGHSFCPRKF